MDGSNLPLGFPARLRSLKLPPPIVLNNYQIEGAAKLLAGVAPIHAWAVGAGKTWLAIPAFLVMRQDDPRLRMVVTMVKSILTQWKEALESVGLSVHIMRKAKEKLPDVDVVLVPATATLVNGQKALADWLGDGFLVLDEAQLYKSSNAKRTQAVYGKYLDTKGGLAERARRTAALSGTFTPNHNAELYPHLRALAPDTILDAGGRPMTHSRFLDQYTVQKAVGPARIMQPVGSKNTEELKVRVDPRITRVTSEQVQQAFPRPRSQVIKIDPADAGFDFLASVQQIVDPELRERALDIHRRIQQGGTDQEIETLVTELLQVAGQGTHLAHIRRALGIAKIDWLCDFMLGREYDRPTLIFNTYVETGNQIAARLEAEQIWSVRIYGDTPAKERDAAIAAVKQRRVAAAILQIDAAGAGLNLQSADTVIPIEPSWSPGINEQAIGRACRLGQDTSVRILWPVIDRTIDMAVLRVLRRKSANAKVLWS